MRWWFMAWIGWAVGCAHLPPVVQAPEALEVDVVVVLSATATGGVGPAPSAVVETLTQVVNDRGLRARAVPVSVWSEGFDSRRATGPRARYMSEEVSAGLWLMIESEARWYAQVAGRYRWTVDVVTTLGGADGEVLSQQGFEVPVFMVYDHEREASALLGAQPVIARRVGELMDEWVRTLKD
jgi:hypothetical protein